MRSPRATPPAPAGASAAPIYAPLSCISQLDDTPPQPSRTTSALPAPQPACPDQPPLNLPYDPREPIHARIKLKNRPHPRRDHVATPVPLRHRAAQVVSRRL